MASIVKVNNIKRATGTTITLGESGDTVALACGATSTGFGSACMSWCAAIKSTGFTAVAGKGYFVNTCGGGVTVTLPASATQGDTIELKDYKRTWGTSALTLNSNSLNYQGSASAAINYETDGQAVKIVYADATQGWKPTVDDDAACGHVYKVQYLVVAGGGAGGPGEQGGGGGAGGLRNVATKSFDVTPGSPVTVTVGGGGAGPNYPGTATSGSDSVFSTITSAGGGYGGQGTNSPTKIGADGGSGGGGAANCAAGGSGNTPPVAPEQGQDGGDAHSPTAPNNSGAGGGGGHACAGVNGKPLGGGEGGDGTVCGIRGTPFDPVAYAGGGGGAAFDGPPGAGGAGGGGASGKGGPFIQAVAGGTNTGGGGGGSGTSDPPGTTNTQGGAGGPGIVIIRRLTASSTSTSGDAVTTCGSDTIHTFTATGTFVP